jgi:chemotaxis protein methyltransferase CheR
MTPAVVERFRAVLSDRFGWRLDTDPSHLQTLLTARVAPHQTPDQYITALASTTESAEWHHLAETLAVSETYFFRNREQFSALAEVALPAVLARRPGGPVRILSAGSASGEEAYSIAMTVLELRTRQLVPPAEIVGVDISRRALDKARRARYSRWALRGLAESEMRAFFDREDAHYVVKPAVAAMVRFHEGNLLSLPPALAGPWDVVFFRNTCMYFTMDAARRIVTQLADSLAPGGYLFLGHAENQRGLSERFELQHTHETFYYVRGGLGDDPSRAAGASPPPAAAPSPRAAPLADSWPTNGDWFHEITRASERVATITDRAAAPAEAKPPVPPTPRAPAPLAATLAMLADERYEEALQVLGRRDDPDGQLVRAVLLTHLARFDDARQACLRVLAADGMHAGAHYVLALCEERAGRDAAAMAQDEMAVHLDPVFAMPHLHLGLIARRRGDLIAAVAHLRAARDLVMREESARIFLFGGGFGRQTLLQLCDAQLASLRG